MNKIRTEHDRLFNELEDFSKEILDHINIVYRRNKSLAKFLWFRACVFGSVFHFIPELKEDPQLFDLFFNKENPATRGKKLLCNKIFIQNLLDLDDRQARVYHKAIEIEGKLEEYRRLLHNWNVYAKALETFKEASP